MFVLIQVRKDDGKKLHENQTSHGPPSFAQPFIG